MDVILRVTVPARALQPRRDDHAGVLVPDGLLPIDPLARAAGAGHRPLLEVLQPGPVRVLDDLLVLLVLAAPVGRCRLITRQPGLALVFPDGGVKDADRLRYRHGRVGVDR